MSRLRAETMPTVTVPPRPNGLPIAITQSPMRMTSESPNFTAVSLRVFGSTLSTAMSVLVSVPTSSALSLRAVGEIDLDLVGVGDDVVVGDDDAARVDDEAGAQRLHLLRSPPSSPCRSLKKSSKKSWNGEPSGSCGIGTVSGPSVPLTVCDVEMLTTASSRPSREVGDRSRPLRLHQRRRRLRRRRGRRGWSRRLAPAASAPAHAGSRQRRRSEARQSPRSAPCAQRAERTGMSCECLPAHLKEQIPSRGSSAQRCHGVGKKYGAFAALPSS